MSSSTTAVIVPMYNESQMIDTVVRTLVPHFDHVVCVFRRKVMVPKESYLRARGGEQPGRPVPEIRQNT